MVVEHSEFVTFQEWLGGATLKFVIATVIVLLLGLFVSYLAALFRHGAIDGFFVIATRVRDAVFVDSTRTSFRRMMAIARLAVQEAIRKRVIVVFVVFMLLLLFGGWFLDVESSNPARLYLSFVLTASTYLVLGLAMFLSAFSLPADVKNRTIYTVVTKPVRAHEIILGRIAGFVVVGTVLLLFMGIASYFFVVRGVNHDHSIRAEATALDSGDVWRGETLDNDHHRHEFSVDKDFSGVSSQGSWVFIVLLFILLLAVIGFLLFAWKMKKGKLPLFIFSGAAVLVTVILLSTVVPMIKQFYRPLIGDKELAHGMTYETRGHRHPVTRIGSDEDGYYTIDSPAHPGELRARRPIYGELRFLDRNGLKSDRGINVGKEWTYRSYIEGNTLNTAIWTIPVPEKEKYAKMFGRDDVLPLEMNIRVFRTNKGNIVNQVKGRVFLVNPDPNAPIRRSQGINFEATEFELLSLDIQHKDLKWQDEDGEIHELNLFNDLVHDGKLEVWVRCREPAQFFGMAQGDVYLRGKEGWFGWNFTKAYMGIWFQMVLVTLFGVLFSSFLSGIVAFNATLTTVVLGMFTVVSIGPLEAAIRTVTQTGEATELDAVPEAARPIRRAFDEGYLSVLKTTASYLPQYPDFNTADKVANGFNIRFGLVARHGLITLAYFFVISVLASFIFRTREFAA